MNKRQNICRECGRVGDFYRRCNACKQKAYRKRQNLQISIIAKTVSDALTTDLSKEDSALVFKLLNTVTTRKQVKAVDQALGIIVSSYRSELSRAKRGVLRSRNVIISE